MITERDDSGWIRVVMRVPNGCSLLAIVWRQGPLTAGWIRSGRRDNSQGFCLAVWNHGAVFSWIRVGCKKRGLGCFSCEATGHPCTDVRQAVGYMSAEMWEDVQAGGRHSRIIRIGGVKSGSWMRSSKAKAGKRELKRPQDWALNPPTLVHAFQSEGCSSFVDYEINWEDNRQYFFWMG